MSVAMSAHISMNVFQKNQKKIMNKKMHRMKLTLPAIRKFRESIGGNDIGGFLIDMCEKAGAGSTKVKFRIKHKPYVVTIEARRLSV